MWCAGRSQAPVGRSPPAIDLPASLCLAVEDTVQLSGQWYLGARGIWVGDEAEAMAVDAMETIANTKEGGSGADAGENSLVRCSNPALKLES